MYQKELDLQLPEIRPSRLCGIDEAGRGPLAGPVTAAALVLPDDFPLELLKDSKILSKIRREELSKLIMKGALGYAIGWVWPHEIDKINIHNASLLAMKRAFEGIDEGVINNLEIALVDGKYPPDLGITTRAVIKGDAKIPSISGASILAKTARDWWMIRYSWIDDRYDFEKHKGYPTKSHAEKIYRHGPSDIQRQSFLRSLREIV